MKGARYHVPDRGAIEGVPDARARADEAAAAFPDAAHEDSGEGDLPLYLDIRRDMHMRLAMGEYTTGAAIPSEAKLAEQYGTTKVTIRNALDGLEEEGLIVRVQGKCTFATHGLEGSVTHNPRGFRDSHRHYQRTPSVRVLEATVREAGEFYARFFGVAPDSDLFYVRRLNCIDGVPFTIERTLIPCELFPGIEDVDVSIFSLYALYELRGHPVAWAVEELEAQELKARDARLLRVGANDPALGLTCVSYDVEGRPLEFVRSVSVGESASYLVRK